MTFIDRLRAATGRRMLSAAKAEANGTGALRFVPTFLKSAWTDVAFRVLAKEGYKANAAVYACVQAWAQAFPEPELHVRQRDRSGGDAWLWEHPARALIERPNPAMGEDEFWAFVVTYMALGGNCYVWKERDRAGRVVALWPLHDGQVEPVPGARSSDGWVSHYLYDNGDGRAKVPVDVAEVIHLRWAIDPINPTRGLSPLVACSRSVDTANEAMRYQYALLKNDAVVSTLVSLKEPVGKVRLKELKRQFKDAFGGDNRGDAAFVEGGDIQISRLGSNLEELAIESLLNVPEANIASAFEVPPGLAGLNVALQRPAGLGSVGDTAVQEFTQRRLVPRWRRVASQFTAALLRDFDRAPGLAFAFDTSTVQALREDEGALITTVNGAVTAGWMTVNEGRARVGLPTVAGGAVFLRSMNALEVAAVQVESVDVVDAGAVSFTGVQIDKALAIAAEVGSGMASREDGIARLVVLLGMTQEQAAAIVGSPRPAAALPAPTAAGGEGEAMPPFPTTPAPAKATAKAIGVREAQALRERLRKAGERAIGAALAAAAARVAKRVEADGTAGARLDNGDAGELRDALVKHAALVSEAGYGLAGEVVGMALPFRPGDAGVRAILDRAAERVTGIDETTRERLRTLVEASVDGGWSTGELAKAIRADESAAFGKARAEMIARTETGTVLNEATVAGYRASGRVTKVKVYDGDDDEPCASANGATWDLDEAEANPLGHPNCVRSFTAIIDLDD